MGGGGRYLSSSLHWRTGHRPRASTCQSRSLKRYLPPHQIKQINVYHNTSDVKVRLKSNEHSNQLEYMQSSRPKTTTNLSQFLVEVYRDNYFYNAGSLTPFAWKALLCRCMCRSVRMVYLRLRSRTRLSGMVLRGVGLLYNGSFVGVNKGASRGILYRILQR